MSNVIVFSTMGDMSGPIGRSLKSNMLVFDQVNCVATLTILDLGLASGLWMWSTSADEMHLIWHEHFLSVFLALVPDIISLVRNIYAGVKWIQVVPSIQLLYLKLCGCGIDFSIWLTCFPILYHTHICTQNMQEYKLYIIRIFLIHISIWESNMYVVLQSN